MLVGQFLSASHALDSSFGGHPRCFSRPEAPPFSVVSLFDFDKAVVSRLSRVSESPWVSGSAADCKHLSSIWIRVPSCVILGGSWDLVSKVISTLNGVISKHDYSYPNHNPSY